MKSLYSIFEELPEHRRAQGIRYPMPAFLTMIIIGYIGGMNSGKSLARYFKNNEKDFTKLFGLLHGVPGSTKTNTFLKKLDFAMLTKKFHEWISQYVDTNSWGSIDGKALGHTVTDSNNCRQNFLMTDMGYIFTLDAVHCQKKRSKPSWSQEMIM